MYKYEAGKEEKSETDWNFVEQRKMEHRVTILLH